MNTHKFHALIVGCLSLAAASVVEMRAGYDDPAVRAAGYAEFALPRDWQTDSLTARMTFPSDDVWWQQFNDSTLLSLISLAESNNFELSQAGVKIRAASRQLDLARSAWSPTLSATAGYDFEGSSGRLGATETPTVKSHYFSLGLDMQWEIDVFGRVAANAKERRYSLESSRANRAAVNISVCANVATAYINLRLYQAEAGVAARHIEIQDRVMGIVKARYEAGLVSALDVAQSEATLLATKASVPSLDAMRVSALNSLATLCGVLPSGSGSDPLVGDINVGDRPLPDYTGVQTTGISLELIRRRPDIVSAELNLASLAAAIGVAKKDFLPTLSLSASAGTSARNIKNLFGRNSFDYMIAPQLSWTIFDGLARNYRVDEARLDLESAVDAYNLTVLTAVSEANDAVALCRASLSECQLLADAVDKDNRVVDLALERYKLGLTDFTTVADALTALYSSETSLQQSRAKYLTSLINIYKALAGNY